MEIGSEEWQHLIIDGARMLGVDIDAQITAAFSTHAVELIKWNRKINLTAILNSRDIAIKHFLDALAPGGFIPDDARLLDIGSGAGFPGIPLKILKPSLEVLLIDGHRKKVNFLKHVIRALALDGIEARQIRSETLQQDPACANAFDIIISRALSNLAAFVRSALPLLAARGKIIAMKGEIDAQELAELRIVMRRKVYAVEIEKYRLPSIGARRSIVIIKSHHL